MTTRNTLIVSGFCIAVFAASFAGTIVARSQAPTEKNPRIGSPLVRWLDLDQKTAEEIESHDPSFTEDQKSHQQALADACSTLAELLDDEDVTNDRIREEVENCIAKHNVLERRVMQYLLTVREHLTSEQQKRLFHLCAEGVRKGRGYGWGRGAGRVGGGGRCEICGRGGGKGRGPGG